jgi:hypothetical protein
LSDENQTRKVSDDSAQRTDGVSPSVLSQPTN